VLFIFPSQYLPWSSLFFGWFALFRGSWFDWYVSQQLWISLLAMVK